MVQTWGNVSGVDRASANMVIKPSGVLLRWDDAGPDGGGVAGRRARSSKASSSPVLIRRRIWFCTAPSRKSAGWPIRTAFMPPPGRRRARRIPPFGTTHADYWPGEVPCTRLLTAAEIKADYEANTGHVIIETIQGLQDPADHPAVLVASHGPFTWGTERAPRGGERRRAGVRGPSGRRDPAHQSQDSNRCRRFSCKNISSANMDRAHTMGRNDPGSSTLKHVETHHHDPLIISSNLTNIAL